MPTRLACGTTRLIRAICLSSGSLSDTPVTLVPDGSQLLTSCAATGSVTPAYTTGTVLVAATTACAAGVVMATMASGLSPMNLRAICAAVAALPCALWYSHFRLLPASKPWAFSSSLTPSRMASSAGCSTIDSTSTDLAACARAGVACRSAIGSAARAASATGRKTCVKRDIRISGSFFGGFALDADGRGRDRCGADRVPSDAQAKCNVGARGGTL